MRKIRKAALMFLAASLFMAAAVWIAPVNRASNWAAAAEPGDFLDNGDFEDEALEPWEVWVPAGADGDAESDVLHVYAGSKAMKLTAADLPQWESVFLAQTSQIDTGEHAYRLSGVIDVDELDGAMAVVAVRFLDEDGLPIDQNGEDYYYPTAGYEPVELLGVTPEDAKYVKAEIHVKATQTDGAGTVYADQFKFAFVTAPEEPVGTGNLLTNGDFESTPADAGWTKWLPPTATGELAAVTAPVDTGSHAFKLTADGLAQWDIAYVGQTVAVTPGEPFKLEAALNIVALDDALVTFRILFKDGSGQYISHLQADKYAATSGYVPLAVTGIVPVDAATADVEVQLKASATGGGGTVFADSLSLSYLWLPTALVATAKTATTVALAWAAPRDDSVVDEYEVYRNGLLIGTSETTAYEAVGLSPTTLYRFTVRARHIDTSLSPDSNELAVATKPAAGDYAIMPLGDSITDGYGTPGGYRIKLHELLEEEDQLAIDFVGSRSNGPAGLTDSEHEGHPGWRIDELYGQLEEWLLYEPQMILIHAGTNDMFDNGQAAGAADDLELMLDKITTRLPQTQVIVSSIVRLPIDAYARNPYVLAYNAQIPGIVNAYRTAGKKVSFVDMYPALGIGDFEADLIHPNAAGYDKMAVVWRDAVQAVIEADDPVPSVPSNLTLTYNDGVNAAFNWSPAVDNVGVTAYEIYRDGALIGTTANTAYTAEDLPPDDDLIFTVRARDAAGNRSLPSAGLAVSTHNLVANAGFETGLLSPWTIWGSGTDWAIDGAAKGGMYVLRLGAGQGGQQDLAGFLPNRTYTLSGWGRMGGNGQAAHLYITGTELEEELVFTGTDYEFKSVTFTSPANPSDWLSVQYWNDSGFDFYLDNLRVDLAE